ncbi:hypothetical protein [Methylobacterium radiodurans]|nr:hypothetical protein [Methylobacterium radiodurans]
MMVAEARTIPLRGAVSGAVLRRWSAAAISRLAFGEKRRLRSQFGRNAAR